MGKVAELKQRRAQVRDTRKQIVDAAEAANRDLTEAEATQFATLGTEFDQLSSRIERLEAFEDDEPATERKTAPGASAGSGGRADFKVSEPNFTNDPKFGFQRQRDFFQAVLNVGSGGRMDERLIPLKQTAGSDEGTGASDPYGGFLIPKGFSTEVLKIDFEGDPTVGRTRLVPMDAPTFGIPARVDTSHATSVAGGLIVYRRSETGTVTPKRPEISEVELKATSLMGVSFGTQELLSDSPGSWMSLLQSSYAEAFASRHLQEVISGTGAGQYLGFMNSPALVTVDKEGSQVADTIVTANVLKMRARVYGYGNAIWLANPDCYPQLAVMSFTVGVGGAPAYQMSLTDDRPDRLLGRPIFYTDHVATVGNVGDIVCVNLREYLEGEYEPMTQAESMHVRFLEHEGCFKFWKRNDGRPWWKSALTPKNGSATRSPFVALQAR